MSEQRKYIDFEIIKEPWNKYSLKDGSILKTRIMLETVWYTMINNKKRYSIRTKSSNVVMCAPTLQGPKSQTRYTPQQLQQNIDVDDSRYDTISYEANEYLLDDGTKILIHVNIIKISRTKLFNMDGDRIYVVDAGADMTITVPKQ